MANSEDPYEMSHNDISPEHVLFAKTKLIFRKRFQYFGSCEL